MKKLILPVAIIVLYLVMWLVKQPKNTTSPPAQAQAANKPAPEEKPKAATKRNSEEPPQVNKLLDSEDLYVQAFTYYELALFTEAIELYEEALRLGKKRNQPIEYPDLATDRERITIFQQTLDNDIIINRKIEALYEKIKNIAKELQWPFQILMRKLHEETAPSASTTSTTAALPSASSLPTTTSEDSAAR